MFKYTIPYFLQLVFSSCTWKVKSNDKNLYLTFDDGPHPSITPWVMDQLEAFNARATFFCVGENVKKYPATYQAILDRGHATGNHTFNHLNGWNTKNEQYFSNVNLADAEIQSSLFRPPYGRIRFSQIRILKKRFRIVMWSLLSRDYEQNLDVNECIKAMKKAVPGDVIVFHDSEKSIENLKKLLPELLQYYQLKGFKMDVIPSGV